MPSPAELVSLLNGLPKKQKTPSGLPNEWHFDLRFIYLQPHPAYVLFLVHPQSTYVHLEHLPGGDAPKSETVSAFFPETPEEAAGTAALALIRSITGGFLGGEQLPKIGATRPSHAPWKLMTDNRKLALAVTAELKRLRVSETLSNIGVSSQSIVRTADETFNKFFRTMVGSLGYPPNLFTPPQSVGLNFKPPSVPFSIQDLSSGGHAMKLAFAQALLNARPYTSSGPHDHKEFEQSLLRELEVIELLIKKPEPIIRKEADEGNPDALVDYGLRLYYGFTCKPDRRRAREYLQKATVSPRAPDGIKATAHALLMRWFNEIGKETRPCYFFSASHHANAAARLARSVNPRGGCPPEVLSYGIGVFRKLAESHLPEARILYKDLWDALDEADARHDRENAQAAMKRLKHPNKYRCANPGCGIQGDTGKMLKQCAGKCDRDKKPSYCTPACQRADWKNHKPFCKPGMPCSVLDDEGGLDALAAGASAATRNGAIQIPVPGPDGSTVMLSSSTMGPEMMREIRDLAQARAQSKGIAREA